MKIDSFFYQNDGSCSNWVRVLECFVKCRFICLSGPSQLLVFPIWEPIIQSLLIFQITNYLVIHLSKPSWLWVNPTSFMGLSQVHTHSQTKNGLASFWITPCSSNHYFSRDFGFSSLVFFQLYIHMHNTLATSLLHNTLATSLLTLLANLSNYNAYILKIHSFVSFEIIICVERMICICNVLVVFMCFETWQLSL